MHIGCSSTRPPSSECTPVQQRAEDSLKALALPYIYWTMKGRKNPRPDPNSVIAVVRHINRVINRDNDDDVKLRRPMRVLKGILTAYVAEYGPILPAESLPYSKPMLAAMLTLPSGTQLGSKTLNRSDRSHIAVLRSCEVSAESGVRLEELAIGNKKEWDLSKMSRASVVWRIQGDYYPSLSNPQPTRQQLLDMTEADGACLSPATSKCDRWGNKHGRKTIFLPYRPNHVWNGARALRDNELAYPCDVQQRAQEPLFAEADGKAIRASTVRTLLYHMVRTPQVAAVTPSFAEASNFSFHSFRKMYATGLARSGASRERIQSMVRWLSDEAVDIYDKMGYDDYVKYVDAAYMHSAEVLTPAMIKQVQQVQMDDNDIYQRWCEHCHIDLTKQPKLNWS